MARTVKAMAVARLRLEKRPFTKSAAVTYLCFDATDHRISLIGHSHVACYFERQGPDATGDQAPANSVLETANRQVAQRAAQLQTITELSEAIAQLQDLNAVFPEATRLIKANPATARIPIIKLIYKSRNEALGPLGDIPLDPKIRLGGDKGEPVFVAPFLQAADTLKVRPEATLAVVEGGRLVGIVSIGDVVKHRMNELEFERDQLDSYVHTSQT